MLVKEEDMDKKKFIQLYWKNYIAIEKEFTKTLEYITLDSDNYETFSGAFIKLLLQIGSEIDLSAKLLCKQYNKHTKLEDINDYRFIIMGADKDFGNTKVDILQHCNITSFKPWESWNNNKNPVWWTAYNMIKHRRMEIGTIGGIKKDYYKFANLKNTLFALGGLYQLLIYIYFVLVDSTEEIKVPIAGSHLFILSGNRWDTVKFYQDIAFFVDTTSGHLFCETGVY